MKTPLNDVTSIDSLATINSNFDKIEQALQDQVLYRNNPDGEPNTVENTLDMNGQDIINIGNLYTATGALATTGYLDEVYDTVVELAAQVEADVLEATGQVDLAIAAAQTTSLIYNIYNNQYLGVKNSDPTTDNSGNSLTVGALYFKSMDPKVMRVYNGVSWQDVGTISSSTTTSVDPALYPSTLEAQQGVNNLKVMTPLRTKEAISSQVLGGFTSAGPITLPGDAALASHAVRLSQCQTIANAAAAAVVTSAGGGRLLRIERYTASGTYTRQTDDRLIEAIIVGPGGAGSVSHGGGAGSTAYKLFDATLLGPTTPVVVGTGGVYSPSSPSTPSSFSGVTAGGGANAAPTTSGAGGLATGGDINFNGKAGALGGTIMATVAGSTFTYIIAGEGGDSSMGGGSPSSFSGGVIPSTSEPIPNTGGGGGGTKTGATGYVELRIYS